MPPHLTFIDRARAVVTDLLNECRGTRMATAASKLTTSADSMLDPDLVALREKAVIIATTSFRWCGVSLWLDGISPTVRRFKCHHHARRSSP
jgi:hypothetical protein